MRHPRTSFIIGTREVYYGDNAPVPVIQAPIDDGVMQFGRVREKVSA